MIKFIGKILLASLFIISSIRTLLFGFNDFVKMIEAKHLPFPIILAILVLTIKLLAGFTLILSDDPLLINIASGSLIIFTLLATIFYHNAFIDSSQFNNMLKNLSIIGGLLLLY